MITKDNNDNNQAALSLPLYFILLHRLPNINIGEDWQEYLTYHLKSVPEYIFYADEACAKIYIYQKCRGPSGPRLLIGRPSVLLTSSFAPYGRSGRVTHAKLTNTSFSTSTPMMHKSMIQEFMIHVSMMHVSMMHVSMMHVS